MLATLQLADRRVTLRRASRDDVPAIVALLADDVLGATRDGAGDEDGWAAYLSAFAAVDADPGELLLAAHEDDLTGRGDRPGRVVGTMQLSFIPGLARRGARRAQIEAVRVHADLRGSGLGKAMFGWAIDEARRRGCSLIQLTSDKQRVRAHEFYAGLGFEASHEGFKMAL